MTHTQRIVALERENAILRALIYELLKESMRGLPGDGLFFPTEEVQQLADAMQGSASPFEIQINDEHVVLFVTGQ